MTKYKLPILLFISGLLTGCADNEQVSACVTGHTYGFWGGLWHGFILLPDFLGMLVWDDVTVYAPNNNGAWYAFGFLLGAMLILTAVKEAMEYDSKEESQITKK